MLQPGGRAREHFGLKFACDQCLQNAIKSQYGQEIGELFVIGDQLLVYCPMGAGVASS